MWDSCGAAADRHWLKPLLRCCFGWLYSSTSGHEASLQYEGAQPNLLSNSRICMRTISLPFDREHSSRPGLQPATGNTRMAAG